MKPVTVRYVHRKADVVVKPRCWCLGYQNIKESTLTEVKDAVESEAFDEIVLIGPGAVHGWHLQIDRPIHFELSTSWRESPEEQQAAYRVHGRPVTMDKLTQRIHMISPLRTIQELVDKDAHYPWRVMVSCMLLNQTNGREVRPMIESFFAKWPTPEMLMGAGLDEIYGVIKSLGFGNKRTAGLKRMTQDYRSLKRWQECYGIGPYALDALDLFVLGKTNLDPQDTWLVPYRFMRQNGLPPVYWEKDEHMKWRETMKEAMR